MSESLGHRRRRARILRENPEVRSLFGPSPETAWLASGVVAVQFGLAWAVADSPWWLVLAAAYAIGAFLAHYLNVVIHECSHNLVFRSMPLNKALGIWANVPGVLPSAMPFRHYHLLHHRFLGRPGLDADVASAWEVALVGRSRLGKLIWVLAQPFTYAVLNPLAVRRRVAVDAWLVVNCVAVIAAAYAIGLWWGPAALGYLGLSVYFAVGPHPTGAHILQEHIVFDGEYETASYYGSINAISINHGLHVEHHDFPNIPGSRLSTLRQLAPGSYAGLFRHRSRLKTLWTFIMDPRVGLDSRVTHGAEFTPIG
jgi:sphingolipid delta-4 desaturase